MEKTDHVSVQLSITRGMIWWISMSYKNLGMVKWILALFHSCLIKFKHGTNGSHLCLSVKNQRLDWVGINDLQKFRYSKMNLDSVPLLLLKFKYRINGAHLFLLLLIKFSMEKWITSLFYFWKNWLRLCRIPTLFSPLTFHCSG